MRDIPKNKIKKWINDNIPSCFNTIFLSIDGADAYGIATENSDFDIKGVHISPSISPIDIEDLVKSSVDDNIYLEVSEDILKIQGSDYDFFSYEVGKYCENLLKSSSEALEMVYLPCIYETDDYYKLKDIIDNDIKSKNFLKNYMQAADSIKRDWCKNEYLDVKPVIYSIRWGLSGLHLAKTGELKFDIKELCKDYYPITYDESVRGLIKTVQNPDLDKIERYELIDAFRGFVEELIENINREKLESNKLKDSFDRERLSEFLISKRLNNLL